MVTGSCWRWLSWISLGRPFPQLRSYSPLALSRDKVGLVGRASWLRPGQVPWPATQSFTNAGDGVVGRLCGACALFLAPDTCVRKTETSFQRLGWKALVVAKFVPGLALFAAPVAGALRMPVAPFLVFDSIGSLFYNVVVIGLGFALHDQLDRVVSWFHALGSAAIPAVVAAILAYWAWRIIQKRRILRALRCRRLTPDALRVRLESGAPLSILDLRTAIAFEVNRQTLPGAMRVDPEELDSRHSEIPRDCDIVLYCTCPNETTSARVALALKKRGIERVFPLEGGIEAWLARGYPVEVLPSPAPTTDR